MQKPVLMPEPNNIRYHGGYKELPDHCCVNASEEVLGIFPAVRDMACDKLALYCEETDKACLNNFSGLTVKLLDERELAKIGHEFGICLVKGDIKAESYFIDLDPNEAVLAARDARGFFYGLCTLKQLIVGRDTASGSIRLKSCTIFDYPHVKIRGMHLYLPASGDVPFFKNLVAGLAELKYNTLYLEVSAMEYKRHPEINEAWLAYAEDMNEYPEKAKRYQSGFHSTQRPWYINSIHIENGGGKVLAQDEVRDLVGWCRRNLVEVIPEVQSLSHCGYLVIPHREIAENPDDPYPDTYCPSNPKSYELLFDVIDEVIDVFRPESVSIGHDEWYSVARCPVCREKDPAELLTDDVMKIHGYLRSKGVKTHMFGDKLLDARTPDGRGQGGAFRVVEDYFTSEVYNTIQPTFGAADRIPRDILIQEWYWGLEPESHEYFREKGFDIVYGNFDNFGMQMRDWEAKSRKPNVLGGFLSHWDQAEEGNMAWDGLLTDTVCSSRTFWNERSSSSGWDVTRDRALRYMPYFRQQLGGEKLPSLSHGPLESIPAFVRHEKKEKYYMSSSATELRNYMRTDIRQRPGKAYFKGLNVELVETAQEFRIAVLNDRADSLVFRHNTDISLPYVSCDHGIDFEDYLIGIYTVEYSDGAQVPVKLYFGRNIGNLGVSWGVEEDASGNYNLKDIGLLQAAYYTRPWIKTLNDRTAATVFDYEWVNPRPEMEISSIRLKTINRHKPFSIFVYDIYGIRLCDET